MRKKKKLVSIIMTIGLLLLLTGCLTKKITEVVDYVPDNPVQYVGAAALAGFAVDQEGSLYTWGYTYNSGLGDEWGHSYVPERISGLADVQKIVGFEDHYVALTNTGNVYTWGDDFFGQLGNGDNSSTQITTPIHLSDLDDKDIVDIASGYAFTLCLTKHGSIFSWGYNGDGQLGNEKPESSDSPERIFVYGDGQFVDIAAGRFHSVALTYTGKVYAWGNNKRGQLGNGEISVKEISPVEVSGLPENIIAIEAARDRTYALTSDGVLYAWGENDYGQLGDGSTQERHSPVKVIGIEGKVIAVSAGALHTIILTDENKMYAWGMNEGGQLGIGTTIDSSTPKQVNGLDKVMIDSIVAGDTFSLALTSKGALYAWGYNGRGELGDGNGGQRQFSPFPVLVKLD